MVLTELLTFAVENKVSDLHLSTGLAPMFRVDGELRTINRPALLHQDLLALVKELMTEQQLQQYELQREVDFVVEMKGLARFRVNAFHQERGLALAFRLIFPGIATIDELGLPSVFKKIASYSQGLVLITGPTGSGKSTSLAAIIEAINSCRHKHILSIEDPIEFVHQPKLCLINQRQIQRDTRSFESALHAALREDPDVILIGELRDLETIRLAMSAAETGHLVLASLHTNSAAKTINRLIDVFPGNEKSTVRSLLSESLQVVVSQRLVKKTGGGRLAAFEILICNGAIRNLIREDKIAQIYSAIQTGQSKGMQTLDQDLSRLLANNLITKETANELAVDKGSFS